jgi:hypothetical protein
LSVTLFEKMPLQQAFPGSDSSSDSTTITNQLNLFAIQPDRSAQNCLPFRFMKGQYVGH